MSSLGLCNCVQGREVDEDLAKVLPMLNVEAPRMTEGQFWSELPHQGWRWLWGHFAARGGEGQWGGLLVPRAHELIVCVCGRGDVA